MKAFLKRIVLRSLLIISILTALCFRSDGFILIKSIPANVTFFTCDILGNLYVVQKKTLTKYDVNGNILNSYDNKNLGEITSVDVSNPLKILVYYKDFNQLVFLDNTLSISGSPILLEELGIAQSSYSCTSYGNAFWVFDNTVSRLIRFDKNLVLQNQSDNLIQATGMINPAYMIEKNNSLYISDTLKGILEFDKFGTFNKIIPVVGVNSFQIIDNKLLYQKVDTLISLDFLTFNVENTVLPETNTKGAQWNKDLLYVVNKNGISIYKNKQNE